MIRLLLFILIIPFAFSHDEHISLYVFSSPVSALDPGYGVEFASALGNRTILTGAAQWTEPDALNQRFFQVRADGRLLYGSELNTQWYPTASIQWQLAEQQFSAWLGLGFQREIVSTFGIFAETHWRPTSTEFQTRLGLRLWFRRFSALDRRVHSAKPLGAIYLPSSEDGALAPLAQPTIAVTAEPVEAFATDLQPPNEHALAKASSMIVVAPSIVEQVSIAANGWYVHLGLFHEQDSMLELQSDTRLQQYLTQLQPWYDPNRNAYRLLLGPLKKPKAVSVGNELQQVGIENFLYLLAVEPEIK